ncbi:MAG: class I mannose-6-phosphate isomerase [Candidatus Omnitrophica bacterium]|nr:class I mannose-6-phosphate isomerase [Candidatus Omnitrophota bacterium]
MSIDNANFINLSSCNNIENLSSDDMDVLTKFPIKFIEGNFADYIWGGHNLYDLKGLPYDNNSIIAAESWEVSGHKKYPSRILMQDGRILSFPELLKDEKLARLILGDSVVDVCGNNFPMLVKFVDVHKHMSAHLHPSHKTAKALGENDSGKEEVFIVLGLHEGAESALYLGLKDGIGREVFETAISKKENILSLAHKIYVKPGDIFRIPSGVLHCWTGGSMAVEITESSDLTYRLYDFSRRRPMHIEKGLAAFDYNSKQGMSLEEECRRVWQPTLNKGVDCIFTHNSLKVERLVAGANSAMVDTCSRNSFEVLMGIQGVMEIASLDNRWFVHLNKGSSLLLPSKAGNYRVLSLDQAEDSYALRISMKVS